MMMKKSKSRQETRKERKSKKYVVFLSGNVDDCHVVILVCTPVVPIIS
jgi:hypothetical protein